MKRPPVTILCLLLCLAIIASPLEAGASEVHVQVSFSAVIILGGLTVIIAFGVTKTALKDRQEQIARALKDRLTETGNLKVLRW